jgi:hypothetical protein
VIWASLADLYIFKVNTYTVGPVFVSIAAIHLRDVNAVGIEKN